MNEESLNEIKQMDWVGWENLKPSQIVAVSYLIEQAERVQELEKDIKEWEIVNESWVEINTVLVRQNKRYRKLLEEVIDEGSCLMIDKIANVIY